jgi:hypothetical protein
LFYILFFLHDPDPFTGIALRPLFHRPTTRLVFTLWIILPRLSGRSRIFIHMPTFLGSVSDAKCSEMLVEYFTRSMTCLASHSFSTDVIERFSFVGTGQGIEQGGKIIFSPLNKLVLALAQS